jgi:hypothetical protein
MPTAPPPGQAAQAAASVPAVSDDFWGVRPWGGGLLQAAPAAATTGMHACGGLLLHMPQEAAQLTST